MVWCTVLNLCPKWSPKLSFQSCPEENEGKVKFQIQCPISCLNFFFIFFFWDRFHVSTHKSVYFWFGQAWNRIHWLTAGGGFPQQFQSSLEVLWCWGMPVFSFKMKSVFLCSCVFQDDFCFFFLNLSASAVLCIRRGSLETFKAYHSPAVDALQNCSGHGSGKFELVVCVF